MTSFDCYWHWLFINLSIIFQDFKQPVDADHSGWSLDLLGVTVLWLHVPPIRLGSHSDSNSPSTGTETADKWWELFADAWETREAICWSSLYFTCAWSKAGFSLFRSQCDQCSAFPIDVKSLYSVKFERGQLRHHLLTGVLEYVYNRWWELEADRGELSFEQV